MNRIFKVSLITACSIALLFVTLYVIDDTILMKKSQLELIAQVDVDSNALEDVLYSYNMEVVQTEPLVAVIQGRAKNLEHMKEQFARYFNKELPIDEFCFDEHYMLISLGRKIVDLKYSKVNLNTDGRGVGTNITFDSQYSERKLYIYKMDKILLHERVEDNDYYIMNDGKRERIVCDENW